MITTVVEIKSTNREEMKDWCYQNVGNINKWDYRRSSKPGHYVFWFTINEDALVFKLRFSG